MQICKGWEDDKEDKVLENNHLLAWKIAKFVILLLIICSGSVRQNQRFNMQDYEMKNI